MKNTTSKVRLYFLMAEALLAWLHPASLLAVDLDFQNVGSYHPEDIPNGVILPSGKYAFALGLLIDVSDPTNPKLVRRYDTSGWPYGLPVSTNFTYAPDPVETWLVTDRTDPAHPQVLGSYKTMAMGFFGTQISGKYAYTISGVMRVIDISDPANPQHAGSYEGSEDPQDVAISGNYAYLAAGDGGLHVLDISNPLKPTMIRIVTVRGYALSVAVLGDYALVGAENWLQVFDVRNPANPQPVLQYVPPDGYVGQIRVSGNYVCWGRGVVEFFDTSDPANPKFAGRSAVNDGSIKAMALTGNFVYRSGFSGVFYVTALSPANPQRSAYLAFGTDTSEHGPGGLATGLAVAGGYAYVTDNDTGVQVVDISDTTNPRRVGGYGTRGEFLGVAVSGRYAYVSGKIWAGTNIVDNGLHVLDVSDPANPRRVGGTSFPGYFNGPVVSGNDAYLPGYSLGDVVFVFDLNSPTNPRQVGRYHPAGYPAQLAVSGIYAYIATSGSHNGLEVVDISDPGNPRRVGSYNTFNSARSVAVSGRYAFVAIDPESVETNGGLIIIDISDPQNPRRIGNYGGHFDSVAVSGNLAYVGGYAGLQVVDLTNPADPRRVGGNSAVLSPNCIAVSGEHVFVSSAEQGFVILDLFRPLRLEPLTNRDSGTFRLRLDGPRGVSFQVQRSSNLADWEDWKPVIFGAAPAEVSDPEAATTPRHFYRAVSP